MAGALGEADADLSARVTPELVRDVLSCIPDGWLAAEPRFAGAGEHRAAYADYLLTRLAPPRDFAEEAANARSLSV